ncbi:uncharacterized protein LOC127837700 isoform X1 [Dreissena polymorpha]|uniref:uncharacterized protein LOC127837700 isoform X1 n=1 Tax=Dreissena polymorpha TaxID=45954 RepID=UPI002263F3FD|nr:uncharacterized protein LOC127837700 isoform X1 [Dreissena polymorpha]
MPPPDMDVIKEVPGYKVILKAVLKSQIQQLVEQLAEHTDEESVILTASVADGTLSHLGSESGKSYLDDHEDVKSSFLGFCLKKHHMKQLMEKDRQQQQQLAALQASAQLSQLPPHLSMIPGRDRRMYPGHMGSPRHASVRAGVRHEPYTTTRPRHSSPRHNSPRHSSPRQSSQTAGQAVVKSEPVDIVNNDSSNGATKDNDSQETSVKSLKDHDENSPSVTDEQGRENNSDNSNDQESSRTSGEIRDKDPNVSVKLEEDGESNSELEITGVEPGQVPAGSQDSWDPNVSMGMAFDTSGLGDTTTNLSADQSFITGAENTSAEECTATSSFFGVDSYPSPSDTTCDLSGDPGGMDCEPPRRRFKAVSDRSLEQLKLPNTGKTTDRQTKWAVRLLKAWMSETGYESTCFETLDPNQLDLLLQKFYAALQTKDGSDYSKAALTGIRAGLQRYLTCPPLARKLNLMRDTEFLPSNQVLMGLIKLLKKEGKNVQMRKEPISDEDLTRLYESGVFSNDTPCTLQNKVLYDIMCYFGIKSHEPLQELRKDSFIIVKNQKGQQYVRITAQELDRLHLKKGKELRMYETGDAFCPVESFQKYLSKLHPQATNFLQRPIHKFAPGKQVWYDPKHLGINCLGGFMSRLSREAGLSQSYSNYCVRALGEEI